MPESRPFSAYVRDTLHDRSFSEGDMPDLLREAEPEEACARRFEAFREILARSTLESLNESQLENSLIRPMLESLGWLLLPQETKIIQGRSIRPDWTLFADRAAFDAYCAASPEERRAGTDGILAFAEIKAAGAELDTGRAMRDANPYLRLLDYLTLARLDFGILANGAEWILVDNRKLTAEKRFLRVDLAGIARDGNLDAFRCFCGLFHRDSFVAEGPDAPSLDERIRLADAERRATSEEELRRVVYGADGGFSLFEEAGRAILAAAEAAGGRDDPDLLDRVYENSLYFVFRLLFVACFEDRHGEMLERSTFYSEISLRGVAEHVRNMPPDAFTGWFRLRLLFDSLNRGEANLGIPLFNGGLFSDGRAPLLRLDRVMDNRALDAILTALLQFEGKDGAPIRRDFAALSTADLGAIYESLLEFEFRVADGKLFHLVVRTGKGGGEGLEGFFDAYDTAAFERDGNVGILRRHEVPKGALYLANSRNSRKASASFYTPPALARPLVREAVDHHLETLPEGGSVLDLRILDSACGSGHLLVECLDHLARRALDRLDRDAALRAALEEETARLDEALAGLGLREEIRPDEATVLRRILLKKVIHGVDIQPFAVDLAHLSLWLDTFVFGTPLSLIEHHVKAGNSLIGATIADFEKEMTNGFSLLNAAMRDRFRDLHAVCRRLGDIRDITSGDIAESKRLFSEEIAPALRRMNILLDLVSYRDMLRAEEKEDEAAALDIGRRAEALERGEDADLAGRIAGYRRRYGFFNFEAEFPEAFANGGPHGFHIIVGNPPWDKTKFEEPLFFTQYRSNYRLLPNSGKREIRENLLAVPAIRRRYEDRKAWMAAVNARYLAAYPECSGAGDGDLFRLFVGRNLRLLADGGTLNYVIPTALLTDDSSAGLRRIILEEYHLRSFDGLDNRRKLFPPVNSRYKFGLIRIARMDGARRPPMRMRFGLADPADLAGRKGRFSYSRADLRALSPKHLAFLELINGRIDLPLLRAVHDRFKPLDPAWMDFRNELHATQDRDIFLEERRDGLLPLFKGASFWQYDPHFAESGLWLDAEQFDARLREREISRLIDDVSATCGGASGGAPGRSRERIVLNALGLKDRGELARFVVPDRKFLRIGFRGVASDTNERTLVCALLPRDVGAQHSLWLAIPKRCRLDPERRAVVVEETPVGRMLFVQALLNSIPADWVLRFSATMNVTKSILMRQPLPQPSDADLEADPALREIVRSSLLLSLHHDRDRGSFRELQERFGVADADIPGTRKLADMLKMRIDVLMAGIYGFSRADMAHILESFPVLRAKRPEYVAALLDAMPA